MILFKLSDMCGKYQGFLMFSVNTLVKTGVYGVYILLGDFSQLFRFFI